MGKNKHFSDDGLVARFLFAMPPDQSEQWTDDVISDEAESQYRNVIKRIFSLRTGSRPLNPKKPLLLTFSEPAKKLFIDFYNANTAERAAMKSSAQQASWSKSIGFAARIALVFHLTKWAEGNVANLTIVDNYTMKQAIRLVQWFKRESLRIIEAMKGAIPHGAISQDVAVQIDTEEEAILDAVQRNGKITVRDLATFGPRTFRGEGGSGLAEKKLRGMVTKGLLTVNFEKGKKGRGKEVFKLATMDTDFDEDTADTVIVDTDTVDADTDTDTQIMPVKT